MKKRILKSLTIDSISAVDRPAQKGATVRIIKSANHEETKMTFKKADVLKATIEEMAKRLSPNENKFIAIAKLLNTPAGRKAYADLREAQDFPSAA